MRPLPERGGSGGSPTTTPTASPSPLRAATATLGALASEDGGFESIYFANDQLGWVSGVLPGHRREAEPLSQVWLSGFRAVSGAL